MIDLGDYDPQLTTNIDQEAGSKLTLQKKHTKKTPTFDQYPASILNNAKWKSEVNHGHSIEDDCINNTRYTIWLFKNTSKKHSGNADAHNEGDDCEEANTSL